MACGQQQRTDTFMTGVVRHISTCRGRAAIETVAGFSAIELMEEACLDIDDVVTWDADDLGEDEHIVNITKGIRFAACFLNHGIPPSLISSYL